MQTDGNRIGQLGVDLIHQVEAVINAVGDADADLLRAYVDTGRLVMAMPATREMAVQAIGGAGDTDRNLAVLAHLLAIRDLMRKG